MAAALGSSVMTCKCICSTTYPVQQSHHFSFRSCLRPSTIPFSNDLYRRRIRGASLVSRAGPSSTQYIFAFVFPLSLLAITIFTAFRIGDTLDQKFLEELTMDEAIREAEKENDDATEPGNLKKKEPALHRARNRPKREV